MTFMGAMSVDDGCPGHSNQKMEIDDTATQIFTFYLFDKVKRYALLTQPDGEGVFIEGGVIYFESGTTVMSSPNMYDLGWNVISVQYDLGSETLFSAQNRYGTIFHEIKGNSTSFSVEDKKHFIGGKYQTSSTLLNELNGIIHSFYTTKDKYT